VADSQFTKAGAEARAPFSLGPPFVLGWVDEGVRGEENGGDEQRGEEGEAKGNLMYVNPTP